MIHSIKSNNPHFKTVEFHPGFNVVLAERIREATSTEKDTRNGAGKTTLIEIIHFCLGAKVSKDSIFKNANLKGWSFVLTIDIGSEQYDIERYIDTPNKLYISGDIKKLLIECKYDKKTARYYVSPTVFNKCMLGIFYGLEISDENVHYMPSFRELISYAVRRNVEGYKNAFEFFSKQKAYSVQTCNAYFLNLNMEYAAQFQSLKDKKKGLDDFKNATKSGIIGAFSLNIGELSTEVFTRQNDVDSLKQQLNEFQIHPQYNDISNKANELTEEIHKITNIIILRKKLLERYENSFNEETSSLPILDIEKIYNEAGILFKDTLTKKLDEVINFHRTIVANRREYLNNEINNLKNEIDSLKNQLESLSNRRAAIMKILETHGALDEYILIQDRYTEAKQLLEDAKKRLKSAEYIEDSKSRLKIENQELLLKARQDYNERIITRENAISLFKSNTEFLYPEAGTLTIDLNENGYSFGVNIKSSRSQGVNYMKVFCYDLVLSELGKSKKQYPDFLIHDSTIFDGVDERQITRALMLSKMKCEKLKFQYICLVNSDMVPYQEFDVEFTKQFNESVVLQISDNKDNGGLLGIRF